MKGLDETTNGPQTHATAIDKLIAHMDTCNFLLSNKYQWTESIASSALTLKWRHSGRKLMLKRRNDK